MNCQVPASSPVGGPRRPVLLERDHSRLPPCGFLREGKLVEHLYDHLFLGAREGAKARWIPIGGAEREQESVRGVGGWVGDVLESVAKQVGQVIAPGLAVQVRDAPKVRF